MFDDGAHNDGASGDNVYGASITVSDVAVQYYIYAENTTIGRFSPDRAEHEFYSINATYPTLTAGQLVVNEIMASNSMTVTDDSGAYEDWFELYNNTANTLSLDNLYASDSTTNLLKWQFPSGTTIAPYSYLIVWADSDLTQTGLHADFKFSAGGENCVLSYPDGTIIESVTFGAQTTDMGYARVPNGTGSFVIQAPTFNANNQSLGINDSRDTAVFKVYPNPTNDVITIASAQNEISQISLYNMQGQLLLNKKMSSTTALDVDLSVYSSGIYLLKVNGNQTIRIVKN
jgi:hypothetical protein